MGRLTIALRNMSFCLAVLPDTDDSRSTASTEAPDTDSVFDADINDDYISHLTIIKVKTCKTCAHCVGLSFGHSQIA